MAFSDQNRPASFPVHRNLFFQQILSASWYLLKYNLSSNTIHILKVKVKITGYTYFSFAFDYIFKHNLNIDVIGIEKIFDKQEETMRVYVCPVCGYIHAGEINFNFCPVCGSPSTLFFPDNRDDPYANWNTRTRRMIQSTALSGRHLLEGKGTTRKFLNMDGLIFLPAQINMLPRLDEEEVFCQVILGKKASQPITAKTPILNAAMSFGALSKEAKMALAKASSLVGGVANTGEGGMLDEERQLADKITLQYASGRFGISEERLKQADMIEIKISQGAKPGMGGKLPGGKVTPEIARIRQIPPGKLSASPSRHSDIHSPADLSQKIAYLRELTGGKPVSVKLAGGHLSDDLEALFSQSHIPDVLVIDGGEGGTGAAPIFVKDHVGLPLIYALPKAAEFIKINQLGDRVTLIAAGGIRHSADAAKALALGAEAVYMAGALKIALGCRYIRECHLGTCPYGIATQNKKLRRRLNVDKGARQVANFIRVTTDEIKNFAGICGKDSIHGLNPNDLASLSPELTRVTGVEPA
jgi:glutamate synthase domain-containing protein 2